MSVVSPDSGLTGEIETGTRTRTRTRSSISALLGRDCSKKRSGLKKEDISGNKITSERSTIASVAFLSMRIPKKNTLYRSR